MQSVQLYLLEHIEELKDQEWKVSLLQLDS